MYTHEVQLRLIVLGNHGIQELAGSQLVIQVDINDKSTSWHCVKNASIWICRRYILMVLRNYTMGMLNRSKRILETMAYIDWDAMLVAEGSQRVMNSIIRG